MGVVVDHSGLTVEGGRRVWKAQVAWVLCAGALGFAEAAFFSGLLRMPRYWFLVAYVVVTGAFLYAYFRSSGIDFGRHLRRRWIWGLVGAVLIGALMVVNVLGQQASPRPGGVSLIVAFVWLGIVYGVVDGLLLNVLPVMAVWRAFAALGIGQSWPGRILTGAAALGASLFVTAAYHLGYAEFRGPELVSPLIGNGVMTLGYLLTTNPLTAVGAHVVLHTASVLHGIDTTVTLPPHYQASGLCSPSSVGHHGTGASTRPATRAVCGGVALRWGVPGSVERPKVVRRYVGPVCVAAVAVVTATGPASLSRRLASLVLGCDWALWHWRQFFMQDSYIAGAFPIGSAVFWVGWVLPTVLYTWIYNHTARIILSAILLHFMVDFWGELLSVRGEVVVYRSVWMVVVVIAIVLIRGPKTLRGRRGGA